MLRSTNFSPQSLRLLKLLTIREPKDDTRCTINSKTPRKDISKSPKPPATHTQPLPKRHLMIRKNTPTKLSKKRAEP